VRKIEEIRNSPAFTLGGPLVVAQTAGSAKK
jgi:hypothetical protein